MTGMVCVAMAGLALLMTNVQLGALFGRGQTTFVGLLSGCYDVSAIMQLLIKVSDVSYCIVLYCIVWYGIVLYCMVWYGMVWYCIV